jgi:hypothetical protein
MPSNNKDVRLDFEAMKQIDKDVSELTGDFLKKMQIKTRGARPPEPPNDAFAEESATLMKEVSSALKGKITGHDGSRSFEVIDDNNFYGMMIGRLVFETPNTYMLEFKLNEVLGGTHRAMFYKHQVKEDREC